MGVPFLHNLNQSRREWLILGGIFAVYCVISFGIFSYGKYIFALDYAFGVHPEHYPLQGMSVLQAPLFFCVYALYALIPSWLVNMLMWHLTLASVIIVAPLALYRMFRGDIPIVALLFVGMNPFVYERMLAGQWQVVLGYAGLAVWCAGLYAWIQNGAGQRYTYFLSGSMVWMMCTSPHALAMACVVGVAAVLWSVPLCIHRQNGVRTLLIAVACVVLGASFFFNIHLPTGYSDADWYAYAPTLSDAVGSYGTVLSLHGFWAERHTWALPYSLATNAHDVGVLSALLCIVLMVVIGCVHRVRSRERRIQLAAGFLATCMCGAFIVSFGAADTSFQSFNIWLSHFPGWDGFRDSQKWEAVLAIGYSVFFGEALRMVIARSHGTLQKYVAHIMGGLLVCAATPYMLFGFSGQIRSTTYPESWYDIQKILAPVDKCRAVFLPWKMYYAPSFVGGSEIISPASSFFTCDVLVSDDPENGTWTPVRVGKERLMIETYMRQRQNPDFAVGELRARGVQYIIVTEQGTRYADAYWILEAKNIEKIYERGGVALYNIR